MFFSVCLTDFTLEMNANSLYCMVLIKSNFLHDQYQFYSTGLFLLQIPKTRVIFELWVYIKTGSSEPR